MTDRQRKVVQMATRGRGRAQVRQLPDRELRFASCRSMGHEWTHRKAVGIDDSEDGFRRPLGMSTGMIGLPSDCPSCGTRRMRWVTRSGEVLTRYEYADGYSRHGDDRLTTREWRSTYVSTLFEGFEASVTQARQGRKRA